MVDISPKLLKEFKQIIKEEYGYEFKSEKEAHSAASNLVGFFKTLIEIESGQKEEDTEK